MRTYLAFSLALTAAGLAVGCGDSDTEIGSETGYSNYVSELVNLLCESGANCCGPNFASGDCKRFLPLLAERPDPEKMVFHPDFAEQCLAATRVSTACAPAPDVCSRVVEGLVPPGASCETSLECVSDGEFLVGGRCSGDVESENRHCLGTAALGEACDGTCSKEVCRYVADGRGGLCPETQGLVCGSAGVCEAQAQEGGACDSDTACAPPLTCDGAMCVPPPGVGEPCTFTCATGSYCNPDTRTCAPTVPIGGACTVGIECGGSSCVNGTCYATGFVCFFFGGGAMEP